MSFTMAEKPPTELEDVISKVEHYKALGMDRVYMDRESEIPWDLVTDIETGGTYRLGLSTSQSVIVEHPCGLTLRWSVDLEPRSANGTGTIQIDIEKIRTMLRKCPSEVTKKLRAWMAESATTVDKHATELRELLARVESIANLFREASSQ